MNHFHLMMKTVAELAQPYNMVDLTEESSRRIVMATVSLGTSMSGTPSLPGLC